MGEFKAGLLFTGVFIYFAFFIAIADAVGNIEDELPANLTLDYTQLTATNLCNIPRYEFDAVTGQSSEMTGLYKGQLDCDRSKGIISQSDCEGINGCSWENVTDDRLWIQIINFFQNQDEDTYNSCVGTINASSYGIDTKTLFGKTVVDNFLTDGYWDSPDRTGTVCLHPKTISNESLCSLFSCTWAPYDYTLRYDKPSSIINVVKDVFSFRYNFGFDNQAITTILNIIFVVIPILLLLISIYMMLPLIN